MSKERLEKARKILNHIKGYGVYDGNDDIEIFKWLIKQAERVQELEETNKKNYWIAADFKFENLQLEQQNKRYREAIIEALHGLKTLPSVAPRLYLISILDKALEGEK